MLPKTWKEMEAWPPFPLYTVVRILTDPLSLHQLRTFLIDGPFLNQKTYKYIWISYSLKYLNIRKDKFNYKKKW